MGTHPGNAVHHAQARKISLKGGLTESNGEVIDSIPGGPGRSMQTRSMTKKNKAGAKPGPSAPTLHAAGEEQGGQGQGRWDSLDEGIMPLVASRLHACSRKEWGVENGLALARLVCRQWAAELPQGCTRLEVKGVSPNYSWGRRFSGLEDLQWTNPCVDLDYETVMRWPKMRSLRLRDAEDTDLGLLEVMPGLTSLTLNARLKGDQGVRFCGISDKGLKGLKYTPSLTTLDLRDCSSISNAGLKELKHLTSLTSLNLFGCGQITNEGLEELIKHLPCLTSLDLGGLIQISSEGLRALKHTPCLTSLNLDASDIMDVELKELKNTPRLTSLSLRLCYITDEGLKELKHLTSLTSLSLSQLGDITDMGLKELKHLTSLTSLDLWSRKITDRGLQELKHLTSLTSLSLVNTNITDEGLQELKHLPNLTSLNVCFCQRLTNPGILELLLHHNKHTYTLRIIQS